MKKLVSILSLVLAITFGVQAQHKRDGKHVKLSEEQQTNLAIKKMILALDLSEKQQAEIKPILMAKAAERKSMMEQRKADREAKKRPTDSEVYKQRMSRLDNQIAMKKKMKSILNKEQFDKFEKMQKHRNLKEMHKKKNKKKGKGEKRGSEHREDN